MDTLTAADAIRLGSAMKKRQAFGVMTKGTDGSCAYGALLDGAGMLDRYMSLIAIIDDGNNPSPATIQERLRIAATEVFARFPVLMILVDCPSSCLRAPVGGIIAHLNDTHAWTREKIADWVEARETEAEFNAVANKAASTTTVEPQVVFDTETETVVAYG